MLGVVADVRSKDRIDSSDMSIRTCHEDALRAGGAKRRKKCLHTPMEQSLRGLGTGGIRETRQFSNRYVAEENGCV